MTATMKTMANIAPLSFVALSIDPRALGMNNKNSMQTIAALPRIAIIAFVFISRSYPGGQGGGSGKARRRGGGVRAARVRLRAYVWRRMQASIADESHERPAAAPSGMRRGRRSTVGRFPR